MKTSVFIATSLDGYIARPDGRIDWLTAIEPPAPGEDYGYSAFAETVDCLVIGRGTLDVVLTFPEWPYAGKRVMVLSRTLTAVPTAVAGKVELYNGSLSDLVQQLAAAGHQRLYVDGGQTIQAFLRENLITDMVITTIPVLLGEGLPLFGPTGRDIPLTHVETTSFGNGLVQSAYTLRPEITAVA